MKKIIAFGNIENKDKKELNSLKQEQDEACDKFESKINQIELKLNNSKGKEISDDDLDDMFSQMAGIAERRNQIREKKREMNIPTPEDDLSDEKKYFPNGLEIIT